MDIHDLYSYFWRYFRKQRIARFFSMLGVCEGINILDVGGTAYFWELARKMNLPLPRVTILNFTPQLSLRERYSYVSGDGRCLPFADKSFDAVFCNSVVEHIASEDDRRKFADEIRRVARSYFVQTPDWRFPVEPHLLTPFVHWLPETVRMRISPSCSVRGMLGGLTAGEKADLRNTRLLNVKKVKNLFPESKVVVEKFCLMPKSIVAFHDGRQMA